MIQDNYTQIYIYVVVYRAPFDIYTSLIPFEWRGAGHQQGMTRCRAPAATAWRGAGGQQLMTRCRGSSKAWRGAGHHQLRHDAVQGASRAWRGAGSSSSARRGAGGQQDMTRCRASAGHAAVLCRAPARQSTDAVQGTAARQSTDAVQGTSTAIDWRGAGHQQSETRCRAPTERDAV